MEQELVKLRVMEGLLADPAHQSEWWEPQRLRPDVRPQGMPARLRINFVATPRFDNRSIV